MKRKVREWVKISLFDYWGCIVSDWTTVGIDILQNHISWLVISEQREWDRSKIVIYVTKIDGLKESIGAWIVRTPIIWRLTIMAGNSKSPITYVSHNAVVRRTTVVTLFRTMVMNLTQALVYLASRRTVDTYSNDKCTKCCNQFHKFTHRICSRKMFKVYKYIFAEHILRYQSCRLCFKEMISKEINILLCER